MIEFNHIYKSFHVGRPNEVTALQDVNLHIAASEFLILVGSNGSGKSTLLNLIAGNVFPTSGEIKIAGQNVNKLPEYKRSQWLARVFQNPLQGTAPELSIVENFRLASLRTSPKTLKIGLTADFKKEISDRVAMLGLGLENKLQQAMGSLSGGQRQALSLLMAVMADIKILLLDEPTAALDPRSAEIVLKTANKLIKDYSITAIMITHNLKDAHQYGSRIIQLHNGEIVRDIEKDKKESLSYADMYEWFI
ncbi:ABC transporter ATP-binding protein [Albibacterium bauzanense]|uniref:Putative ABC transport system ATP-binding protein n=1 Tax=Albibacterium bauzanense TaxID=653929 RepID=A0A4R1M309_9SPHI|nr:ATP-binding cassette domain-containing protein [Albibacterium bauzanense]TCK85837.1 putative ABC transport system ATP-binding protein [Albibacterium bauzanense]